MECNKDEAVRARQIAEARMQIGEFVEALKFATKAKKLYPDVESITQILTICEVHYAAQKKLSSSDMDWYAILQIQRLADEATIKKQYRRLALILHPDKNKFAGAEAAFKLIGQANVVLSDQTKRSLYDNKVGACLRGATPKTSHHCSNGNVFAKKHKANAPNNNMSYDSHHFSNGNVCAAKHDANATNCQKSSNPNSTGFNNQAGQMTFWTSCQHCNTKYQYHIQFVNANLLCQQCKKPFEGHVISFAFQGVSPSVFASVNIQKEAPMHGPPKPASENTRGKPLGREHVDTSMKKCSVGVGSHCGSEKSKGGNVSASGGMESRTSKNIGSQKARQSAPSATNCQKKNYDSQHYSNGNVFATKHDADTTNYQKNRDSHQFSNGNAFTTKPDANAKKYQKNSSPNTTSSNKQAKQNTFWTCCQHCNSKYEYCIPFVNATLRCVKCCKSFKARAIPLVNIQKESPMHGPPKPASEIASTGREHTVMQSNPTSSKRCAVGVGVHCEGENSKDIDEFKDMKSQTFNNVGSKRLRQSAPDSGEIPKAINGEEMKDANVRGTHVDPSRVNAMRYSRKKQRVSNVETSER